MSENRKTYRIRTVVGSGAPASVNVNLNQTFDVVDVLSLEINQKNFYKMPSAGYGVIVGRVLANGGFGIPNAKVSVFIPYDVNSLVEDNGTLYHYTSPTSTNSDGIRYNLLPRRLDEECHQNVGTMYEKEYMLDNKDLIQVFDKYYKYTAVTNDSGDYFIYGVPVGSQTVHVDLDLSDIGVLSQRPRDMVYKGYNINQFDSPNKFKKDTNLNSLAQIYSQDRVVTVYPFWGDTTVDSTNGTITRCDINIDYKFEPTCVFMGSIVSDTGSRAISQRCVPDDEIGKMSELITGEGTIEMIRKTFDGKVEQFSIKGNALIDSDGVWCYQIPMNLDYVITDEFGNMVPTDDPSKGIPTRTRVRFRIGMNETATDDTARKRARFLVPNNPKLNNDYPNFNEFHEADYEFGTFTKEESYRDMFWNKVYTVKSYVPRLQKAKSLRRRVHTGIKNVNHAGQNNPFPFNNLFVRLTFTYRFLCTLMKIFCLTVYFLNTVLGSVIGWALYWIGREFSSGNWWLFTETLHELGERILNTVEKITIKLDNFCDDGNYTNSSYVPVGCVGKWCYQKLFQESQYVVKEGGSGRKVFPTTGKNFNFDLSALFNCIENQLAQDQECTSFNFSNDWVNGVLYAPLWYRKVRSKRRIFFNLIPIKSKDRWCDGTSTNFASGLALCQTCAQKRTISSDNLKINPIQRNDESFDNEENCYGYKCHKKVVSFITLEKGLVMPKETMFGENVYYYKSVEYDNNTLKSQTGVGLGDVKTLFATDIVLLGSLNSCDSEGVPQFFNRLEGTTYNMPPDLVIMDYDSKSENIKFEQRATTEHSSSEAMNQMGIGYSELDDVTEEIDESRAIIADTIHTDTTGADWGNYGSDQIPNGSVTGTDYLQTSENEKPDFGGLFYGLTCWSTYTKPKSCVNLSRVCEYGVSLDEVQSYPNYNERDGEDFKYTTIPPDGFISYDELYDNDGRAMFATMNGNNLRTKINPENGFPVYDFMYLYPENFDGLMKNIMNLGNEEMPSPQSGNYNLENSSESYIRFRYGRNRDDSKVIQYYDSSQKLGLYISSYSINKNRFPKYENSFYFYFGLIPGNTAIDKFRTQYYSDCKDTEGEKSVVLIEYEPNSWCSEVRGVDKNNEVIYDAGDGWLKIDATYVAMPYKLWIENMSGNPEYGYQPADENDTLNFEKIFVSYCSDCANFPPEGYEWLTKDGQHFGLLNGQYRIRILDNNGDIFSQTINFEKPFIQGTFNRSPFRYKNSELIDFVEGLNSPNNTGDVYEDIASLGGRSNENMSDREIGGFIKVTNVKQEGTPIVDFAIEITPMFDFYTRPSIISGTTEMANAYQARRDIVTSYNGSYIEVRQQTPSTVSPTIIKTHDQTLMNECSVDTPPYCPYSYDFPQNNGVYDFRFGVPKGGEKYRVTLTMICGITIGTQTVYYKTRNSISDVVVVPEPIQFKMFLNGVDYEFIKNFETGWVIDDSDPSIYFPDNYNETNVNNIVGWDSLTNIDGIEKLDMINETESAENHTYSNTINYLDLRLSYNKGDEFPDNFPLDINTYFTSDYSWSGVYLFNPNDILTGINKYNSIPTNLQSDVWLIQVRQGNTDVYYFYQWDNTDHMYKPFDNGHVETISLEDYFDNCHSVEEKNNVITVLNNIVDLRKNYVVKVISAFVMYNGGTFNLSVTNETYETPVKTLIYYSPDLENGTSHEFELLDNNKNANIVYGITNPTLTGTIIGNNGRISYPPGASSRLRTMGEEVFFKDNEQLYKKPTLTAIQNVINETIPSTFTDMNTLPNPENNMPFGVHYVDKRLTLVYNSWACIQDCPYFYDNVTYGEPNSQQSDYHERQLIIENMKNGVKFHKNGLFAGFLLNGTPESYDEFETVQSPYGILGTNFENQTLSYRFGVHTISDDSDTNHTPLDNRIPTVRFIYDNYRIDVDEYRDYDVGDSGANEMRKLFKQNGDINREYLLIESSDDVLDITDKQGTNVYIVNLAPTFTIEHNRITNGNTITYKTQFIINGVESGSFAFCPMSITNNFVNSNNYNGINPIYIDAVNPSNNVLVFPNPNIPNQNFSMQFDSDTNISSWFTDTNVFNTESTSTLIIDNNDYITKNEWNTDNYNTLYCVIIDSEKQNRMITKTYDIKPIEYVLLTTGTSNEWTCCINLGLDKTNNEPQFNYLRYYDFTLVITIENENGETPVFEKTFVGGYDGSQIQYNGTQGTCIPSYYNGTNFGTYYIQENIGYLPYSSGLEFIVYITDITGLTHKCVSVGGEGYEERFSTFDN